MIKKEWLKYHYKFTRDELKEIKFTEFLIELDKKTVDEINDMIDCLANIAHQTRKMYDKSKPDNDFIEKTMLAAETTFTILSNYKWKNGFAFPHNASIHDEIARKRRLKI